MGLSFRTARKLWMSVIALFSLICIFLAAVLWVYGYGKSNNFGVLVAIPCLAFSGSMWTIFKKRFFSPQIVCMEATWVFVLLPFQILLALFVSEFDSGALHTRFTTMYELLVALAWTNATLVFIYAAGIVLLALLTQLSCHDQEVWARDIDSSPCPFPFPILLVYAFPSASKYVHVTAVGSREDVLVATTNFCLPGCPCYAKPNAVPALDSESANYVGSTPSSIPIRIPTAVDRQNAIHVTLEHMTS